jgi:DNA-binding CsgD family transcriptional regulator
VGKENGLEGMANKLLRQANAAADPEYPAFSDHYMAERDKRRAGEVSLEEVFDATVGNLDPVADLFEVTWNEIRSGAAKVGCSTRQIEFLEMRICLQTYKEIADATGWNISTVYHDLKNAANRIQHIPAFGLWTVLSEVFRVDIHKIKVLILCSRRDQIK